MSHRRLRLQAMQQHLFLICNALLDFSQGLTLQLVHDIAYCTFRCSVSPSWSAAS